MQMENTKYSFRVENRNVFDSFRGTLGGRPWGALFLFPHFAKLDTTKLNIATFNLNHFFNGHEYRILV